MGGWGNQILTVWDYPQFCDITALHLKHETTTADLLFDFIDLLIQHSSYPKAPWKWNKNGNIDPRDDELSNVNISQKNRIKVLLSEKTQGNRIWQKHFGEIGLWLFM